MQGMIDEGLIDMEALDGIAPEPDVLNDPEVTPDWVGKLPLN